MDLLEIRKVLLVVASLEEVGFGLARLLPVVDYHVGGQGVFDEVLGVFILDCDRLLGVGAVGPLGEVEVRL